MKSEVFDGHRFWSYFQYDLLQMWRNHVKAAVGIGLAGLIAYFVVVFFSLVLGDGWQGPGAETRIIVFVLAGFALSLYYTRIYGYVTDKRRGSNYLMLPASTLEKWISMMLIALLILPVLFLLVSLLVDALLCALDPGIGASMWSSLNGGLEGMTLAMGELNAEYHTQLAPGMIIGTVLLSVWVNFLYFLLCGLCFRRNKILGAILINFGLSMVFSILLSFFGLDSYVETLVDVEEKLRGFLNGVNIILALEVLLLMGGIYYRLKTIKH